MATQSIHTQDFVELREDVSASPLWNPDLAPTTIAQRTWSTWNIAALWIGMSVVITTYTLAGGMIAAGMLWWQAMLTILLGNTIVLIPMTLNAHAGTKYGVSFPVLLRASFGTKGANVAAMARALVACGWFGIQSWIAVNARRRFIERQQIIRRIHSQPEKAPPWLCRVPTCADDNQVNEAPAFVGAGRRFFLAANGFAVSENLCHMKNIIPLEPAQIERNLCDISPAFNLAQARVEADRCLYCYDAPCTRACPTHIDVPAFIKKIASGNLLGSARVIFDANPIGATCARVCPTSALCEGACVENTLLHKPIEIGRLQRYATDFAMDNGRQMFFAGPPNGKSVAVIGAGPAGYSCAVYLARLGYGVTVYDRRDLAGGLDTYGMAEYKMTQRVSVEETDMARHLGVKFELGSEVTPERLRQLETENDAVFLGVGLGQTARLGIEGERAAGVYDALEWIEKIKSRQWNEVPIGKVVCVIGAGNTAVDAATQAKRLGAERVIMVYRRSQGEMPAYPYEYELAKKDAIEFRWKSAPVAILTDASGEVCALRCIETGASEIDELGRVAYSQIEGSEFEIPCDMIIKALGQSKMTAFLREIPGLILDKSGRVEVDARTMATGHAKFFAGGDCVNGGREAVDAAQMGKLAAMGIHAQVCGEVVEFAGANLPFIEKLPHEIPVAVAAPFAHPEASAGELGVKSYAAEG